MEITITSDNAFWTKGVGRLRLKGYLERMLDAGEINHLSERDSQITIKFPSGKEEYLSPLKQRFPELTYNTNP